jgi:very-short-patch-repair endonuclease
MGRSHKSLDDYLQIIPEKYRSNLKLLDYFKGNRTNVSFTFSCGCKTKQSLKSFLLRDCFIFCTNCKSNHAEIYTCNYCSTNFIKKKFFEECQEKCKSKYIHLILNEDYVICSICSYHAKSLGTHVAKVHNINPDVYKEQHQIICKKSSQNYSESASENSWLSKAVAERKDLTEYWSKVSTSIKKSINSKPEEIKRRSELMTELNKKQQSNIEFQKIVSETAKKTSARKDIQEARSQRLKEWRKNNPSAFYNKCIKKMITAFQSKPEKILYEHMLSLEGFSFKKNGFLKSKYFTSKSKRKQIDIYDKNKRIYIEYDGIFHFEPKFGDQILSKTKQKDSEIEEHIKSHNWTLIRVSYDQFIYSTKTINKVKHDASYFKQECLDEIIRILNSNIAGIYKIGSAYN